ncbi:hypothetical protein ACHAWF_015538 [Thalassiosira exigua]
MGPEHGREGERPASRPRRGGGGGGRHAQAGRDLLRQLVDLLHVLGSPIRLVPHRVHDPAHDVPDRRLAISPRGVQFVPQSAEEGQQLRRRLPPSGADDGAEEVDGPGGEEPSLPSVLVSRRGGADVPARAAAALRRRGLARGVGAEPAEAQRYLEVVEEGQLLRVVLLEPPADVGGVVEVGGERGTSAGRVGRAGRHGLDGRHGLELEPSPLPLLAASASTRCNASVVAGCGQKRKPISPSETMASSAFPPLLPKVDAILVLDGDGNRLAGKYYGDFMKAAPQSASASTPENGGTSGGGPSSSGDGAAAAQSVEQLRASFERQLQSKIGVIAARPDAAEVVTVLGKTAVFCGGSAGGQGQGGGGPGDVRVVHVGPAGESELVLAHLVEGMYEALGQLMGGATDRAMILDNLELVFLLIDEHCDGGIILETEGHKLASSVLLRDEHEPRPGEGAESAGMGMGGGGGGGQPASGGLGMGMGGMGGDMTIGQALMQARNQIISNLSQS